MAAAKFLIWAVYVSTGILWFGLCALVGIAGFGNAAIGMVVGGLIAYVPAGYIIWQLGAAQHKPS